MAAAVVTSLSAPRKSSGPGAKISIFGTRPRVSPAKTVPIIAIGTVVLVSLILAFPARVSAADAATLERGAYIYAAAGCQACHTDSKNEGPVLAGGRALVTPFGTYYSPNITADPEHGIGRWSDADFLRSLRQGRAPDGSHYFPVFPYTAFTRISDEDIKALKAYIFSLPTSDRANRPHDVGFPFSWRFLMTFWKWLYFEPGPMVLDPAQDAVWNRGAYLARALGHCGECHTPRNALGALDHEREFAGALEGPEGGKVPNITPDPETGIGDWSDSDLLFLLRTGLVPSGDVVGSTMGEVIENSTSKLTEEDQKALIAYLRSVAPVHNRIKSETEESSGSDDW